MNITSFITKAYENKLPLRPPRKQTQSNPISKGDTLLLYGALLRTSFEGMTILKISAFSVEKFIKAGHNNFVLWSGNVLDFVTADKDWEGNYKTS